MNPLRRIGDSIGSEDLSDISLGSNKKSKSKTDKFGPLTKKRSSSSSGDESVPKRQRRRFKGIEPHEEEEDDYTSYSSEHGYSFTPKKKKVPASVNTKKTKKPVSRKNSDSSVASLMDELDVGESTDGMSEQIREAHRLQERAMQAMENPEFVQRPEAGLIRRCLQAPNEELQLDPLTFNSIILGPLEMKKLEREYGGPPTHTENANCFGCSRGLNWAGVKGSDLEHIENLINECLSCTNYASIIEQIDQYYKRMKENHDRGIKDQSKHLPAWEKRTIFHHIFYHTLLTVSSQNLLTGFFKGHFRVLMNSAYHVPLSVVHSRRGKISESDLRVNHKTHRMLMETARLMMSLDSKVSSGSKMVYNPYSSVPERAITAKVGNADKWLKAAKGSAFGNRA